MTPRELVALRERGKVPEVLVCSFVGRLRRVPWPVMPVTGREDPRLFAGLDVVLAHDTEQAAAVVDFACRLYQAGVLYLEAWSVFEGLWTSIVCGGMKYISRIPPSIDRFGEVM